MKRLSLFAAVLAFSCSVCMAEGDAVVAAAKKLGESKNYSWKTTFENGGGGGGGGFRMGPSEGMTEMGGYTHVTISFGDNKSEAVLKGDKGAIKTEDGWQTIAEAIEAGNGQRGPATFLARRMQSYKAPAAEAEEIAGKAKSLKEADGAWAGDLTEEGVKGLLMFGGRRGGGGNGPTVSDASGSVKFWIKDGVLSKYEYKVKGTMSFNGNDRDVDRTVTVEVKDVGTTKVEVPEEAKKKLG